MPFRVEAAEVVGKVQVASDKKEDVAGVVVSLIPLNSSQAASLKQSPIHATLTQKHKNFVVRLTLSVASLQMSYCQMTW